MPGTYPFNPYAQNSVDGIATRFVDEVHSVSAASGRNLSFVVPNAAPFFMEGLVVKRANNTVMTPGVDYILTHHFNEATQGTGRPVYGSIAFLNRNFTGQVKITYKTLGGTWVLADNTIITQLTSQYYLIQVVTWAQITGLPVAFPPIVHDHDADDLTGMSDVIAKLDEVLDVVVTNYGDTGAFTNQLNAHITASNAHSKAQVGLPDVVNVGQADETEAVAGSSNKNMSALRVQQKIASLNLQNGATTNFTLGAGTPTQAPNVIALKNSAFFTVSLPDNPPTPIPSETLPLKNGAFYNFIVSQTPPPSPVAGDVWLRPIL